MACAKRSGSVADLGRIAEPLRRFVLSILGSKLDYHALYPCTVVVQNTNDTLALLPDDERVKGFGLDGVPIKTGIPGVTVKVLPEARVLLGFEAADPARPYAALWTGEGLSEIVVTATVKVTVDAPSIDLGDALAEVLRNGETVDIIGTFPSPGPGTMTAAKLIYNVATAPGGPPAPAGSKVKA